MALEFGRDGVGWIVGEFFDYKLDMRDKVIKDKQHITALACWWNLSVFSKDTKLSLLQTQGTLGDSRRERNSSTYRSGSPGKRRTTVRKQGAQRPPSWTKKAKLLESKESGMLTVPSHVK